MTDQTDQPTSLPTISPEEFFRLSSVVPASYFNAWRVFHLTPGIVRITLFEQSFDRLAEGEPIQTVIHPRGAFVTTTAAFVEFLNFATKLAEAWKADAETPKANYEPPIGRPN